MINNKYKIKKKRNANCVALNMSAIEASENMPAALNCGLIHLSSMIDSGRGD